ncbi:MAG: hypothetical protein AAF614_31295 [Chloroflexota bacterium]
MSSQKPNIIQEYVDYNKDPRMTLTQLHDATTPAWSIKPLVRLLSKLRAGTVTAVQHGVDWVNSTTAGKVLRQRLARS